MYLDIFILDKTAEIRFGIELKYKTRAASFNVGVETFTLKNHGASDINCYLFIKDICRLEKLIIDDVIDEGYAVLVTNDPSYKLNSHRETNASAFRIYHGRNLNGTLMWGPKTGAGTMKGNEDPLELRNAYRLKWDELTSGNHPEPSFHGLIVQVTK